MLERMRIIAALALVVTLAAPASAQTRTSTVSRPPATSGDLRRHPGDIPATWPTGQHAEPPRAEVPAWAWVVLGVSLAAALGAGAYAVLAEPDSPRR